MEQPIIKIEDLSKAYQIGQIGTGTISRDIERFWITKVMGRPDPFLKIGETNDRSKKGDSNIVWSLKDINFEINKGDAVGIIGKNGAGKSTLLKILSRVTGPTTGEIKIKGRIASLLEVGTGFHPELSGKENIYLNGAILGMRKKEITRKLDEIIDFSGVERYIDTPVKRYSSGMYVRLAFAVAAHLESEILIVDEVLAVGDAEFQKKCLGKMGDISKGEGRTVLFVSHNMGAVKNLCNKGVYLQNGMVNTVGDIGDVISAYQKSDLTYDEYVSDIKNKDIYLKKARISNAFNAFHSNEEIAFDFQIAYNIPVVENKFLLVRILDDLEIVLFSAEVALDINKLEYQLIIPKGTLVKGNYKLNCIIYHPAIAQYDNVARCCNFSVIDNIAAFSHLESFDIGKVYLNQKWL
ncbi:ABC transporter ATP-binding protein [Flavobacterium sp. SUN046]|uniref:ABC transporter ATP-binding protein n=1 Tax=Flavobacterium sp. SUN046 TaxID=3002440 RepID=UPI002DBB1330|nr:ABC transporter ATP-binding protein [Flavobacterium sp. SUN046]MEC4050899.1 ABC transporter ATP-binding protein [Flavobacterium sp. SUN046]